MNNTKVVRTYIQLPKPIYHQLKTISLTEDLTFAETTRRVLEKGLIEKQNGQKDSSSFLVELGKLGKKYKVRGPKDWSTNLDKYTWDE